MLSEFLDGVLSYAKAFRLISKYNLWKYLFISGLLSLVIGGSLFSIAYGMADDLGNWLIGNYFWDFGKDIFVKIASFFAGSLLFVGSFLVYKYVVMIIVSPIMSLLSENLEYKLSGIKKSTDWNLGDMLSDVMRGVGLTVRNITKEIFFTLLLIVASFIPAIGFISAPAIFVLQSYYAGFGNIDFYMERRMNISETTDFVNSHKGLAIGNGMVYMLILIIPIFGLIFAPTLGTISATYEAHKRMGHINDFV